MVVMGRAAAAAVVAPGVARVGADPTRSKKLGLLPPPDSAAVEANGAGAMPIGLAAGCGGGAAD